MVPFYYTLVEGEKIIIDNSSYWGETIFKNCNITINVTSKFLVTRNLSFINSKLIFKKRFTNYCWADCFFDSCSFEGQLSGNDFGNWPSYFIRDDEKRIGDIVNCDFSKCDLASCRILDSSAESNRFPEWPNFTLFDPALHVELLRSIKWPDNLDVLFEGLDDDIGTKISSVSWNFKYLTKYTTSDKVYDMLKELPFVKL
ncbi:hypothetical protein SIO70_17540 [Chitinophaga sancti]|uniref:hypothetical protein n=1 Tax=Chitinophaga sancti TaxID=1004 RepID=UPI002A75154B|nr:hypothetical protein [Chitinophaga sancti]WPQ60147.1 hypothetical protein SIO70_17540 [Chitinophaga sancti]